MFKNIHSQETEIVSFLLVPEYSMIALFSAIEPLRIANGLSGKSLFQWQLISEDGGPVIASNGMSLNTDLAIAKTDKLPNLIVCASFDPQLYETPITLNWLRKLSRQGTELGALDTGCHLLAKAGLLDGYSITLHWDAVPAFREEFPFIDVTEDLFEVDRNRFTCAGGTASIDMMLHLITLRYGRQLALDVCEQFIYNGIRDDSAKQRLELANRLDSHNPHLLRLVELMECHIQPALSIEELAAQSGLSRRQIERLFKQHLNHSPSSFYMELRLDRALQLLTQTGLSAMDVAIACGFNSASHFSRAYRRQFGRSPKQDRQQQAAIKK